jgi:hypothetical protein
VVLTGIPFIDCIILFHMIFFSYFANNPAWISGSQTIWRNVPVTTLPAPITHPSPMVTPPQTTTLDASQQLSFIVIGFA